MKGRKSISVSVRRHFVDIFFHDAFEGTSSDIKIIDIGGKKKNKRGLFNTSDHGEVTYVNIDKTNEPDILASADNIPVNNDFYDVAVMGELLEHIPEPEPVIREARRILKFNGLLFISVPFNYPVHGDPDDYARYTDSYWKLVAEKNKFEIIKIEKHGSFFAVLGLMVQHLFRAKNKSWEPVQSWIVKFMMWLDERTESPILKDWTTGYGIIMRKK